MYQLVRARYKLDRRSGRWVEADLAKAPITRLATTYGDVWLYITYPSLTGTKALRLSSIQNLLNGVASATTVQQWLTGVGNQTLPFAAKLPDESVRLVQYAQAWHAGYDVQPVGRNNVVEDALSAKLREDLLITHPKFTPQEINDYCLPTVNGYFHLSDYTEKGVRVIDGNTSLIKANDNQIGLYSFQAIGKIKRYPITANMIQAMNNTAPLVDGVYVTLPPEADLENKTVLLCLGGYLLVLNDAYKRTGERTWKIEMTNIMFLDRYFQSLKQMDLSALGITPPKENPTLVPVAVLRSDAVVKAYMTLTQSFFVVVDAPSFFQEFEPLEQSGLPDRYLHSKGQQLPVVGAYGKQLDYHIIEEHGQFVYACVPNKRHNYDAQHRKWANMTMVDGGRYPARPFVEAQAYLRKLGVEG